MHADCARRYVPHEDDAVLLDAVWADDELVTRARARVRVGTPFCAEPQGWPSWLLIELMAQVVAASAGLREYRPGARPRLGLLLGVRDFTATRTVVAAGTELVIQVSESTRDEAGMGVFDGVVHADGELVAGAILSVYLPDSVDDYLGSIEP